MKVKAALVDGFRSTIDNGRSHELVTDLPQALNGGNEGATALELAVMGFAGCVTTIFKMIAGKMKIDIKSVEVEMEADKGAETVENVSFAVKVDSEAEVEKLERCLEMTEQTCPVGVLFRKAGVNIKHELVKL